VGPLGRDRIAEFGGGRPGRRRGARGSANALAGISSGPAAPGRVLYERAYLASSY
jgi:hypothetical protein